MSARAEQQLEVGSAAPDELDAIARAFHSTARIIDERNQAVARAEHFEREADIVRNENDNLRRQIKRAHSERDHYFRAFTALSAQLDQVASGLVQAISLSRTQAYGGRRPPAEPGEKIDPVDPLPSFMQNQKGPIDMGRFAAAITDRR